MTSHRTAAHALAGIGALVLTVGFLSGCTPEPDPTPTPTAAFASEEEAFAAAEEVYRAYNEAGNAQRMGSDDDDPQEFLIGSALEGYLQGKEYLRSIDRTLTGTTDVVLFIGDAADIDDETSQVTATVCLDVSGTRVVDGNGADVTPASRPTLVAQQVVMIAQEGQFLIAEERQGEVSACE